MAREENMAYAGFIEFLAKETPQRNKQEPMFPPLEFLLASLRGENHEEKETAPYADFIGRASTAISEELDNMSAADKAALQEIQDYIQNEQGAGSSDLEFRKRVWRLLSPEALEYVNTDTQKPRTPAHSVNALREKRSVRNIVPNPDPITKPASEILFTSNVLLTIPSKNKAGGAGLPDPMLKKLQVIEEQGQQYWYDHPMPLGIDPEASELLYGLRGLSRTLQWEKEHGHVDENAVMNVLLSLSVTHTGLAEIAPEYVRMEMERAGEFPGLAVYVISEDQSKEIASILQDLLDNNGNVNTQAGNRDSAGYSIADVFGVDGMYGRHYSFLKAATPLFTCLNPELRATFKIDLDQVFPQDELQEQSGKSALQHFCTPLWGAQGKDNGGQAVELGMIAGALVNEADITKGIFTPDVNYPEEPLMPVDVLFPRVSLMACSTRAEMMTRYSANNTPDGKSSCLQRVHVTGGTNGILFSSLRKHRPFTPSFVGRAEDQAYLMSVYATDASPRLRYVHEPGLIMRHDKSSFASEAIKHAKLGTYAGDLLRTVVFSRYAACLPGGLASFKKFFAPFTSCFASTVPLAASIGRLLLHCCSIYDPAQEAPAMQQLHLASKILGETLDSAAHSREIHTIYQREKQGWQCYYDALDILFGESPAATAACGQIKRVLEGCLVNR